MNKAVYLLLLLALIAGCDWNIFGTDDDPADEWIELENCDFPVYAAHFGDYERTDTQGNSLGTVTYGEGGDDRDWTVLSYDPDDKTSGSWKCLLPPPAPQGGKEPYYVCVRAFELDSNQEVPAAIFLDGLDTGQTAPYTFSHAGAYDQTLESRYSVHYGNMDFFPDPVVTFDPDSDTYTYSFPGSWPYVPPYNGFLATLTAQNQVRINWWTESETELLGFHLRRSSTDDISSAELITPQPVPATNTSQLHNYSYTDSDVELGITYYYWLEHVYSEDQYSQFFGPVSVTLPPSTNQISAAYPNPCQDYFRLNLGVKAGSNATVIILDSQLALRHTYQLDQGFHQLYADVSHYEPGLYRVYVWFEDGYYAYGEVLVQD